MNLFDRIEAFEKLAVVMKIAASDEAAVFDNTVLYGFAKHLKQNIKQLHLHNGWFTEEFTNYQLNALADSILNGKIRHWIEPYSAQIEKLESHNIAVIMAGNIPFVGFHDFLSVLITGNTFIGKMSSKDSLLPKTIAEILIGIEPRFRDKISFTDGKISDYNAVIATGSNNSARYFEYYFRNVPRIIRKSRNSLAILSGNETQEQLSRLADDIFIHFGLGCRNVSKLLIPRGFKLDKIFEASVKYSHLINNIKYANNFDYNRAIYLVNAEKFFENGLFILKQNQELASPVAVVFYDYYDKEQYIDAYLDTYLSDIQCIACDFKDFKLPTVKLGQTQRPELYDYEDNINTLEFILNI